MNSPESTEEGGAKESATSQDSDALSRGTVLGDFLIIREIGRGGMGIVYEAEQRSLQRRVAMKVLPFAAILNQRQLDRFRNEVRAVALLKHPHIVSVYFVGYERGIHFYAMELIEGQSLAELIHHLNSESLESTGKPNQNSQSDSCPRSDDPNTIAIGAISTQRSKDRRSYYRSVARLGVEAAEARVFSRWAHRCVFVDSRRGEVLERDTTESSRRHSSS